MESNKYIIFTVFAIVVKNSLAAGSINSSCDVKTGIEYDLATIQNAQNTGIEALLGTVYFITAKLESVLLEETFGPEYKKGFIADDEIARRRIITAIMLGIPPMLDAIQIIQPGVNISSLENSIEVTLRNFIERVLYAIELTKSGNYNESLAKIENIEKALFGSNGTFIDVVISAISNQSFFCAKDLALVECYLATIRSELRSAPLQFFIPIKAVLAQLSFGTIDGIEHCLSVIRDSAKRASELFVAEVTQKYTLILLIYKMRLIRKMGLVQGVFALNAAQGKPVVQFLKDFEVSRQYFE